MPNGRPTGEVRVDMLRLRSWAISRVQSSRVLWTVGVAELSRKPDNVKLFSLLGEGRYTTPSLNLFSHITSMTSRCMNVQCSRSLHFNDVFVITATPPSRPFLGF